MNPFVINSLLIAAALALPLWLVWQKRHDRPTLRGWLACLLLGLPFVLTWLLHPEWLSAPVTQSVKAFVLLPLYLGLSALAGGLIYSLIPLLFSGGKTLGKTFMGFEWGQQVKDHGNGGITRKELTDPFDIYNDCDYSVYRKSIWEKDD